MAVLHSPIGCYTPTERENICKEIKLVTHVTRREGVRTNRPVRSSAAKVENIFQTKGSGQQLRAQLFFIGNIPY